MRYGVTFRARTKREQDKENEEALGCCFGCLIVLFFLLVLCCGVVPLVAKTFPPP